jgi:hypothetical protein
MRGELAARGEDVSSPTTAVFGIASDRANTDRLYGNFLTPTFVRLRSDLTDLHDRLDATARSCRVAVEARRDAGLDLSDRVSALAPRAVNWCRRLLERRTSLTPSHLVTANVAGPKQPRWLGDIEVVDWFSFANAVSPAAVNLTVHSYDGRMNVGILADPAALPEPRAFMQRLVDELDVLADAILGAATPIEAAA